MLLLYLYIVIYVHNKCMYMLYYKVYLYIVYFLQ